MSFMPQTVCSKCHRKYSSVLLRCPICGEPKKNELHRATPKSDSSVPKTQASARKAENQNWQMIFGTLLVIAVLAAVITVASLGVKNDLTVESAAVEAETEETTEETGVEVVPIVAQTAVPTQTPQPTAAPSATPMVTSLTITFLGYDEPGFTEQVGDTVQLEEVHFPLNESLTAQWASSDESVATVTQDGLVTLVGSGTCTITVTVGELTDVCEVISQ